MKALQADRHLHIDNIYEPPSLSLSPQATFAVFLRAMYDLGYDDGLAGHVAWWLDNDVALVNPRELAWDEVRASDVLSINVRGKKLSGQYNVSPALSLHVGIYRNRPNFRVSVHGHPRWAMVWANIGEVPDIYDQSSAAVPQELGLVDEYVGNFPTEDGVVAGVTAFGQSEWALLANHGVFIVGADLAEAWLRCYTLEWRCRRAWEVRVANGGRALSPDASSSFGRRFSAGTGRTWWDAVVRRTIARDQAVLS